MNAALIALALLAAEPTKTTPADMLLTCSFNDARVDATLLHHVVEVRGKVANIGRDGLGGYVLRFDDELHTSRFQARISVHCHFDAAGREALAKVRIGQQVAVRGIVRQVLDDAQRYVDANVQVTMKQCELVP